MLHIGITGGIASGKSTVASMFALLGAIVIDLDQLARDVMESSNLLKMDLGGYFGPEIIKSDGSIDRVTLAGIVFDSREDREALNKIVHPHVFSKWQQKIDEIMQSAPSSVVVSDVPLLVENSLEEFFDLVILVYVPADEQLRRLQIRDGITAAEAKKKLAAQLPIDEKIERVDLVIDNQGDIQKTRQSVTEIWSELQRRLSLTTP